MQGYGITLGTINCLGVMAAMFQAMPSLSFQARLPTLVSSWEGWSQGS